MKLRDFIRENRANLDITILGTIYRYDGNGGQGTIPNPAPRLNDAERREWVLNDESLYNWARSEGCKI